MNIALLRYGFVLILLALLTGFFIHLMAIPRLGVVAHTVGVMSGILLLVIGAVWPQFSLSAGKLAVMKWCWIYSAYANWLGCLVGAITGAGFLTPVAAAGVSGPPAAEAVVAVLLISIGFTALAAVVLSLMGLAPRRD